MGRQRSQNSATKTLSRLRTLHSSTQEQQRAHALESSSTSAATLSMAGLLFSQFLSVVLIERAGNIKNILKKQISKQNSKNTFKKQIFSGCKYFQDANIFKMQILSRKNAEIQFFQKSKPKVSTFPCHIIFTFLVSWDLNIQ